MISILMPVFNEENHLKECLDSILAQSFENWELIAVDDFSSDSSLEILRSYGAKDNRIYVFQNKEKGIVPALELAYAQSKGDSISRMDADDKMHPDKLELLLEKLIGNPKACVTAKVAYFSEGKLAHGFLRYADWLNTLTEKKTHYNEIFKECVVASPCWMMKREVLEKVGGICSDRYPEDYDLIFRLYQHSVPILGVNKVLHYWRDHENRASRNDPNYAQQDFIELKLDYLIKLELDNDSKVILWGAGRAGKLWAKALLDKKIQFSWVTDNEKKIGKDIYGMVIQTEAAVKEVEKSIILLAIKSPDFYAENHDLLVKLEWQNKVINLY